MPRPVSEVGTFPAFRILKDGDVFDRVLAYHAGRATWTIHDLVAVAEAGHFLKD